MGKKSAHRTTPASDNFPAAANNRALGQHAREALPDLDTEIEHSGYRYCINPTRTHDWLPPGDNSANSAEQAAARQTQQPVRPALGMERQRYWKPADSCFRAISVIELYPQ